MLDFFGLSVPIVQVAGGIVVCAASWDLLRSEHVLNVEIVSEPTDIGTRAFYPLTLPLTVGPGTISIAITIGAHHPQSIRSALLEGTADVVGAVIIAATVFVCYRYADRLLRQTGRDRYERADPAVRVHSALRRCTDLLDGRLRAARRVAGRPAPLICGMQRRVASSARVGYNLRLARRSIAVSGIRKRTIPTPV